MNILYNKIFLEHDTGMHPENRKRLEALGDLPETDIENGEQYLELVHTKEHIEKVKLACQRNEHLDPDTAASKRSYEAAIYAVGATIMASRTNDFAVVRPPGHHAYSDRASGFCLFNNIAIAVQKLVSEGKRLLIFDFDGHLGDGTSATFYDTDRVMYLSLHQFPAFPGKGWTNEIGRDKGAGYTINIPLPPGSGDDIYMRAVNQIMAVAEQFNPDVVAVSAGFDAHQYDLLLELRLTVNTYYKLGKMLREKFDKVFATLEGGYNIEMLPQCFYNFLDGINGKEMRFKEEPTESKALAIPEYETRMDALQRALEPYWEF